MGPIKKDQFDYRAFIAKHGGVVSEFEDKKIIFTQGDAAEALYYVIDGTAIITVNSKFGKEAVVGVLRAGDFFGEGCVDGLLRQTSSVTTRSPCKVVRIERPAVLRALHDDQVFARIFLDYVLGRNEKLNEDLVDQLFNSSEKRLARILLTLANSGIGEQSNFITIPINQETLAHMVGTTRSRINRFMNRFRDMGYIEYNGKVKVHNSLLNLILHDQPQKSPTKSSESS